MTAAPGMMKRVLVAGATGYLGSFVAREFARRGSFVRVLVRSPDRLDPRVEDVVHDVVTAEVTRPGTLEHVCDDIDLVFSSIGITRQRDGLTFQDVDVQGNKNLLDVALAAGVEKFVYVSVLNGPDLMHLDIVRAHEEFVRELERCGLAYTVVRPTGFFRDMDEYLSMARRGRVYLIGKGDSRINPIHGADLAAVCVEAAGTDVREIDVGGPEVLTHREIARLALEAEGRHPRKTFSIPVWVARAAVRLTRLVSRHRADLLAFFTEAATHDAVGPPRGTYRLEDHFMVLAAGGRRGTKPGVGTSATSTSTGGAPRLPEQLNR